MVKCEWCGESYPDKSWDEHFWKVNLFGKDDHIICNCCKKHLKRLDKYEEVAGCKAEGDDGIPPNNKLLDILPNEL